jgi:hypothetical protein
MHRSFGCAALGPLVRTQAIFVDVAASASPGLQDARKHLADGQVQGNSNTRILSHRRGRSGDVGDAGCTSIQTGRWDTRSPCRPDAFRHRQAVSSTSPLTPLRDSRTRESVCRVPGKANTRILSHGRGARVEILRAGQRRSFDASVRPEF